MILAQSGEKTEPPVTFQNMCTFVQIAASIPVPVLISQFNDGAPLYCTDANIQCHTTNEDRTKKKTEQFLLCFIQQKE